jgi:hypothetical protein
MEDNRDASLCALIYNGNLRRTYGLGTQRSEAYAGLSPLGTQRSEAYAGLSPLGTQRSVATPPTYGP